MGVRPSGTAGPPEIGSARESETGGDDGPPRQLPGSRQPARGPVGPKGRSPLRSRHSGAVLPPADTFEACRSAVLLALVAGVAAALAFPPTHAVWLLPFAVAAFFVLTDGLPARRAWLPGLVFGLAFQVTLLFWLHVVGTVPWLGLAVTQAAWYGVLAAAVVPLRRLPLAPAWLAVSWVAMESVRCTWPAGGMPWGRLAYAVMDTPFSATLPYAGSTGVSLVVALLGTLLAALGGSRARTRVRTLAALVAVVAVSLVPLAAPYDASSVGRWTVAAVQGNVPGDGTQCWPTTARSPPSTRRDRAPRRRRARRARRGARPGGVAGELHRDRPVLRRGDERRHPGGRARDRRPSPGRRRRRRRSEARAQPGHRVRPGHRRGGPLHQVAPGAVRRVHPVALAVRHPPGPAQPDPARHGARHPGRAARRTRGPGRRRDLLRRRLRRRHLRPAPARRPGAGGADQQRDVHPHRADRPAVRDQPAPRPRDPSLRRGGCDQRADRCDRPGRLGGHHHPAAHPVLRRGHRRALRRGHAGGTDRAVARPAVPRSRGPRLGAGPRPLSSDPQHQRAPAASAPLTDRTPA